MKSKIMIVDDNELNLVLASGVLTEYEIKTASSGHLAMEQLKSWKPDIILLDIMMPGMDGFEVIGMIKADETLKEIPVIFITAKNDIESLIQGFNAGAVDFIAKPFNPYELGARVKAHLDLLIARRMLEEKNIELTKALEEIKTLKGLIPICANCKNIKDDDGYWHSVEEYMSSHSDLKFTHGLCNDCIRKLYPDLADEILAT